MKNSFFQNPEMHKEEVIRQLNQMLEQGIIGLSTSFWSSPILVILKKLDQQVKENSA